MSTKYYLLAVPTQCLYAEQVVSYPDSASQVGMVPVLRREDTDPNNVVVRMKQSWEVRKDASSAFVRICNGNGEFLSCVNLLVDDLITIDAGTTDNSKWILAIDVDSDFCNVAAFCKIVSAVNINLAMRRDGAAIKLSEFANASIWQVQLSDGIPLETMQSYSD